MSGLASTSIANSMLSWETSKMTNVGIDLNALSNRLSFTADVFVKNTTGILYTPNKVRKYKGEFKAGYDENGKWVSNIGDVASSASAVNPIVEGHAMKEYYLRNPYKGTGKGYAADGVNGGPVDGMIRTESDMEWLKAMINEGYTFMPNKTVKKDKIWYGDYVYADENGDGIYGGADDKVFQGVSSDSCRGCFGYGYCE